MHRKDDTMNSDNLRIFNALKAIADKLGADDKSNVSENEVGKIAEELERIAMIEDLKPEPGGGGASALAGLSDVDLDNPSDGQIIQYDAASGKWKNAAGGSGGGFLKVGMVIDEQTQSATLDKTWQDISDAFEAGWYVSITTDSVPIVAGVIQMPVMNVYSGGSLYEVYVIQPGVQNTIITFEADSADGYPVMSAHA